VTQTETRIFHYDLMGHIIAETNQSGQMLAEYVYLGDQLLAMIKPGEQAYYFHNDHLGTPQVLTDGNGSVAWKATYTPFGQANITVGTVENNFRLPGQYYDQETGLHYNYFRYYNPQTGRYITPDPIGLEGGINLFVYTNNPVNYIDPYGLSMVLIDIKRGTVTQSSTIGTLTVNYMGIGYTLELPDRGNQQYISRIPEGTYFAELYESAKLGRTMRLRDVPFRTDILMHTGNYPKDTEGCILPGETAGKDFVGNSAKAMAEVLRILDFARTVDKALGQPTDIIVRIR
jgi:RHS repeat-associated protein